MELSNLLLNFVQQILFVNYSDYMININPKLCNSYIHQVFFLKKNEIKTSNFKYI